MESLLWTTLCATGIAEMLAGAVGTIQPPSVAGSWVPLATGSPLLVNFERSLGLERLESLSLPCCMRFGGIRDVQRSARPFSERRARVNAVKRKMHATDLLQPVNDRRKAR